MMNQFVKRKTALGFAFLFCLYGSIEANEGYEGLEYDKDCCNTGVYLSSPMETYDFQFRGLCMRPSGSNLQYAAEAFPLPAVSPHWKIYDVKPDYHFGFDIGLGKVFCERNAELSLNWTHFHSKDTASKHGSSSDMIGPFFEIGPDALPYKIAHGKATFNFDAVDLDYGVFVNFGDCLQTNIYGGVAFARINETIFARYSSLDGIFSRNIKTPSTFMGAGPQVGMDFTYSICNGFNFIGGADASILVGSIKNHTSYDTFTPQLADFDMTSPNKQSTSVQSKTQVVPALKGRLGLSYSFTACECYAVNFEFGYEARVYINAIQSVDMGSEVVTPPVDPDTIGVFARTFHKTLSNFALSGPDMTLNVTFLHAAFQSVS